MVNGVLTIPLSGTFSDPRQPASPRSLRLSEYVAGRENALAEAALAPLLEQSPGSATPLMLYGPPGSGKSHLARGLADWWQRHFSTASVACLTAADFARGHADALASSRLDSWRNELRSVRLLILEDLGELRGKRAAQQELLHTLDALADREALVVVTSRSLPTHWPHLLAALRSRLSAGLAVPLALPTRDTRRLILEHLAQQRGLPLPKRALDSLADGITGGVPAILAALYELELAVRASSASTNLAEVEQLVQSRRQVAEPTLRQIALATAKRFGLKLADLKSAGRQRALVTARGVAMYLARQLTSCSLEQIGRFFGDRDHTTALYGCRRTEALMKRDRGLRQTIAQLAKSLTAP